MQVVLGATGIFPPVNCKPPLVPEGATSLVYNWNLQVLTCAEHAYISIMVGFATTSPIG